MTAFRSVRESWDLWHPPEDYNITFRFHRGHVQMHREPKPYADIAPPLVDCEKCLNMEIGEMVFLLEAWGKNAGTIRFQAAKTKLTPAQELRRLEEATAGAPTDSEGWEG